MRPDDTAPGDAATLRRQAEEALSSQPARSNGSLSYDEALALVHELQVHQIELELQNGELLRTRREAEALRDRYADLYDFAPVGYFTLDAVGAIREANLPGAVQLGVDRESLIGAGFATFLHPDSCPGFAAFCARVRRTGATESCDLLISGSPGHLPWYARLEGRAESSGDADDTRLRLVVSDVTARRRAEEELRKSEERFRGLVDDDLTGVFTSSPAGGILDCNPAFARMFGFASVEEARSASIIDTYDAPSERADLLDRLRREGRVENDERFRLRRDGTRFHVVENVVGDFDDAGQLVEIRGYISDDTQRYLAEAALEESERRHAFLLALGDRLRELAGVGEITAAASELVGRHLDVNGAVFCEIDATGELATVLADWTDGTTPGEAGSFRMDDSGISELYRRGLVRRSEDVAAVHDEEDVAAHRLLRIRASLGVPICRNGRLAAVFAVHSTRPRTWTDAEVELVEEAGGRIWDTVERARAVEALRLSEARHDLIAHVASLLLAVDEPQAVVDDLCRHALDVLDGDVFLNYFGDEASGRFVLNAYGGITADEAGRIRWLDCRAAVCGCVISDGCRAAGGAIPDTPDPAIALVAGFGVRAFACHPLVVAGETIGTLSFGARSRDRFSAEEIATMRTIADLIAIAMQRIADRDALRASEARLREATLAATRERDQVRNLLEIAGVMIIALDTEGTVTLINRRGCEILERPEEEVLGRNWVEQFIPERIRQEIDGAVRRMMGGEIEEFRRYENRVLTRDGEERDILWGNRAITGTDGRIVGILSSGEDITERKRAEEELRQALELNTAVLESISDSFLMLDKEWRFIYSNRRALGYSGKDPADVIGRSVWEVFPEILGTPLEAFYRTAMESRDPLTYENRSVVVTGRTFELRSYPTAGGLSIFGTDITERMRSEEVLRETRDYLDSLINYANAPIIVWDPKSRITRFNAAFEHLSGHAADEVIGRDLVMLFPEESREESLEKIQRTITERWQSVEIPILRPDGDVRIALWNSANIYDRSGTTLLATIAQGQDITDRKHAEEALRGYAENLQRSNEDLERFAYVASHDLQEPLRSIVSFSQLLDRRYRGQLGTDADEYIEFIVEGGTRMQGLILDLLAFSRVNTTRQQITQTDAEDVLAEAVRALNVSLRESGATLTHDPLPVVMADPTQLAQVFANLVSNAVKFRKPDEPLQIHVGVRHTDGFCEFSVSDNGIGIEPEYFDKIFVIFQRLHTKETYPGTGIGLAIVKRIIDRHGGTVRVESTPGEGSTFFFTLPAASRINPPITPSDHF